MRCSKLFYALAVAGLLAFSGMARATVYDFGTLWTGSGPDSFASDPFAQLQATDNGGGDWDFKLTINNNLFSSFGDGSFIDLMKFNFTPDPVTPTSTYIDSSAANPVTVTSVYDTGGDSSGGLPGALAFDFGTQFGHGAHNRLSQDDWVSWSVSGLTSGSSLTNMYVHVNGIGPNGDSAKYTPIVTAVPEPGTYAMLLAGLGLIAFTARRRKDFYL